MSQQGSEEELAALRAENAHLKARLDQFERERVQAQRRPGRKGISKLEVIICIIILASGLLYLLLLFVSITKISGSSPPPFWQAVFIALVGTPLFLLGLFSFYFIIEDYKRKKKEKHHRRSGFQQ